MNAKHVIITGATGVVGGCALRICPENPDVANITVIGRRPVGIEHSKLRDVVHYDFMYSISRFLYPLLRRIYPNMGIPSEDLAAAMVHAGLYGTGAYDASVLENRDIRSIKIA